MLQPSAQAQAKQAAKDAHATAAASHNSAATSADYVGSDTCITCHSDQQDRFKHTVMGKVFANPKTEQEKLGCEGCHGAGKAHVEAGGGKETIPVRFGKDSKNSVEEQNSACLSCHQKGNRMFWSGSPHESRGMRCVDCHNVKQQITKSMSGEARFASGLTDVEALKKSQPELCLDCHQMRKAQLQRSSHMPFREGKVNCSSCHNPHGTPNPSQLRQATVNENCYSCHAERRGPFLWSHPPVVENCDTCHEPHGSFNPQLLRARAPRLCQQCHNEFAHGERFTTGVLAGTTGQPTGFSNKVVNRGCANCHSKIHGTNAPSGKFFLR